MVPLEERELLKERLQRWALTDETNSINRLPSSSPCCTGFADVPWAFGAMIDSSPWTTGDDILSADEVNDAVKLGSRKAEEGRSARRDRKEVADRIDRNSESG